jgi:hypothetical protein
MSMRFHFASTFAKLQEWPSEISKALESSPSGAASAVEKQLVEEMKPHDGAIQAVPALNVGAPQVGVAGELESILTAMQARKPPAPGRGAAATSCSISAANGATLSDQHLSPMFSHHWVSLSCTQSATSTRSQAAGSLPRQLSIWKSESTRMSLAFEGTITLPCRFEAAAVHPPGHHGHARTQVPRAVRISHQERVRALLLTSGNLVHLSDECIHRCCCRSNARWHAPQPRYQQYGPHRITHSSWQPMPWWALAPSSVCPRGISVERAT